MRYVYIANPHTKNMQQEAKQWFEKAKKDIIAAEHSINSRDYEWSAFQSHQGTEKAPKALYIKKNSELIKTHDLILLAKKVMAPKNILSICSKINPAYLDTRYPDIPEKYNEVDAQEILDLAKEVIKWIEKNL